MSEPNDLWNQEHDDIADRDMETPCNCDDPFCVLCRLQNEAQAEEERQNAQRRAKRSEFGDALFDSMCNLNRVLAMMYRGELK